MLKRPWMILSLFIAWLASAQDTLGVAQDAGGSPAISLAKKFLLAGWERTPKSRNESESWYQEAPAELRGHPTVLWAYALNRMNHRRYRDAKPLVDQLAQTETRDWDVAYAQIWLATFVDDFDVGLMLMEKVKSRMDTAKDLSQQQKEENYFRLGRLLGYLEGPMGDRVNLASLAKTLNTLRTGIDDTVLQVFNEQREGVIKQYEQLMASRNQKQETQMESLVRQRQVDLEQQTNTLSEIDKQTNAARESRERVISEGQAEVNRRKERLDAVTSEWNRQQAAMAGVRADISALWFTIWQIDDAIQRETDPVVRQQLILQRNYYVIQMNDRELYLRNLRIAGDGIYAELMSASASYDQAVGTVRSRVNSIDQSISSAQKARDRATRRIRSLQAEPKVSNTLVATIDAQAEAMTSYDPFPAEMLKQRLLDSLKSQAK
jgi:hypothetical protein